MSNVPVELVDAYALVADSEPSARGVDVHVVPPVARLELYLTVN